MFLTLLGRGDTVARQGLTKETVVRTAAVLVEENGYENLTLHKLAAKLDIKPASLYTHIKGINELYESLSYFALRQLGDKISDTVKGKEQGEALRAIAISYYDYTKQNPEMYRVIMKVPHSNSGKLVEAGRNVKSILFEVLSQYTEKRKKLSTIPDIIIVCCMDLFHWNGQDFLMMKFWQRKVLQRWWMILSGS